MYISGPSERNRASIQGANGEEENQFTQADIRNASTWQGWALLPSKQSPVKYKGGHLSQPSRKRRISATTKQTVKGRGTQFMLVGIRNVHPLGQASRKAGPFLDQAKRGGEGREANDLLGWASAMYPQCMLLNTSGILLNDFPNPNLRIVFLSNMP